MLMIIPSALTWAEEPKLPDEELPALVATAITNNPELKSSQARWQMFRSRIAQAAPWTTRC